jgi:alkanesulfonate monooxygenase SsuD/methylene tetrahydromethanopterin reductase-like flavin-dependent oxidoreductase (luciferase family)
LLDGFENVRREAQTAGRNPDQVKLACCLPVELTSADAPPIEEYLKGSVRQVADRLRQFIDVGVVHIGLQFMIPHYPERQEQIERFAKEALPALKAYKP